uniref:Variant surface glycoprotein 1853 n=1 Tax=Trypanosoma brucei TaxID=5691 RepID=M4SZI3_9TRYP|nr:variant surface glycoprotein 1853 [Trypanosoma brucei]
MECILRATVAIVSLQITLQQAAATAGDGANAAEFRVMCMLTNLAQANLKQELPQMTVNKDTIVTIEEINLTMADESWTKKFSTAPSTEIKTLQPKGFPEGETQQTCVENYNRCAAAAIRLAGEPEDSKRKSLPKTMKTAESVKRAAIQVLELLNASNRLFNSYVETLQPVLDPEKTKIKGHLDSALDGSDQQTSPNAANRNVACSGKNACTSLTHDLICLCAVDSTSSAAQTRGFDTPTSNSGLWSAIINNVENAYGMSFGQRVKKLKIVS